MTSERKHKYPIAKTSSSRSTKTVTFATAPVDTDLFKFWSAGEVLNQSYQVEGVLGKGGMGVVYRATELATQLHVVLKTPLPRLQSNADIRRRFLREAEAWVRLGSHPHVVRAYTIEQCNEIPTIVAQYVDGGSLCDRLQSDSVPLPQAFTWATQICYGMAHAHDANLIHRDLKPANVLLSRDGVAMVTDFGLAKRGRPLKPPPGVPGSRQEETLQSLLTLGVIGTPEYMPPEQWESRETRASDIYAFGILLYELFCGKRPFEYDTLQGMERVSAYQTAHQQLPAPAPTALQPALPEPLAHLLTECLQKDPTARPTSFRVLAERLNELSKMFTGSAAAAMPAKAALDHQGRRDQGLGLLRLALAHLNQGDFRHMHQSLNQSLVLFRESNEPVLCAIVEYHRGQACYIRGKLEQGLKHANHALMQMQAHGAADAHIARVCNNLCSLLAAIGRFDAAMAAGQRALAIWERHSPGRELIVCLIHLGHLQLRLNQREAAIQMAQRAKALADAMSMHQLRGDTVIFLGKVAFAAGDREAAIQQFQTALTLKSTIGDFYGVMAAHMHIGLTLNEMGRYAEALREYRQSLAMARSKHYLGQLGQLYNNMSMVYLGMGQLGQACALLKRSLVHKLRVGDLPSLLNTYLNLADMQQARGDLRATKQALQRAQPLLRRMQDPELRLIFYYRATRLYLAEHKLPKAMLFLRKFRTLCHPSSPPSFHADAQQLEGLVRMEQGQWQAALPHLRQALDIYVAQQNAMEIRNTLLTLAKICLQTGAAEAARQYLDQCAAGLTPHHKTEQRTIQRLRKQLAAALAI